MGSGSSLGPLPASTYKCAVYSADGTKIATINDVGTSPASISPALTANEAALVLILPPGAYTAIVSGNNGATGTSLLEILDNR